MLDDELQRIYDEEVLGTERLKVAAALDEMDDTELLALHDAMADIGDEESEKVAADPVSTSLLVADTWGRQIAHRDFVMDMIAEGRGGDLPKLAASLGVDLLESARAAGLDEEQYLLVKEAGYEFKDPSEDPPEEGEEEEDEGKSLERKRKIKERLLKLKARKAKKGEEGDEEERNENDPAPAAEDATAASVGEGA